MLVLAQFAQEMSTTTADSVMWIAGGAVSAVLLAVTAISVRSVKKKATR